MSIDLGDLVKDPITGFEGVVTSIHEYLYGCRRIGVQSQGLHENKPVEMQSFDEPQLVTLQKNVVPRLQGSVQESVLQPVKTGGPARPLPPPRAVP